MTLNALIVHLCDVGTFQKLSLDELYNRYSLFVKDINHSFDEKVWDGFYRLFVDGVWVIRYSKI